MSQTKPSIVFVHGIWADGSCFGKVIPALQAEGHEVIASQHSLDTLDGDVATVRRDVVPARVRARCHSGRRQRSLKCAAF